MLLLLLSTQQLMVMMVLMRRMIFTMYGFIKAFADKCLTDSCDRIYYLILNAGIMDISS